MLGYLGYHCLPMMFFWALRRLRATATSVGVSLITIVYTFDIEGSLFYICAKMRLFLRHTVRY